MVFLTADDVQTDYSVERWMQAAISVDGWWTLQVSFMPTDEMAMRRLVHGTARHGMVYHVPCRAVPGRAVPCPYHGPVPAHNTAHHTTPHPYGTTRYGGWARHGKVWYGHGTANARHGMAWHAIAYHVPCRAVPCPYHVPVPCRDNTSHHTTPHPYEYYAVRRVGTARAHGMGTARLMHGTARHGMPLHTMCRAVPISCARAVP